MTSEKFINEAKFGMIGLGTMGRNFLLNVAEHGFSCVGFDVDAGKYLKSVIAAKARFTKSKSKIRTEFRAARQSSSWTARCCRQIESNLKMTARRALCELLSRKTKTKFQGVIYDKRKTQTADRTGFVRRRIG
jgi:3-hydroxyacyl-CoA dehydrogenase